MNPTSHEPAIPTVAIIGGGVSGLLVAVNLLRFAKNKLRVLLLERMSDIGPGVAYGTRCPAHLLNVPASRMGAFPDQVDHFFKWVKRRTGQAGFPATVAPGDFLPRQLYGVYLQEILADALAAASPDVEFVAIKGEVSDIEGEGEEVILGCADGRRFPAHRVVLAIGNLPGEYPIRAPLPIYKSQRYVHVPWRPGALAGIPRDADVLLVGAGLTATDLILQLHLNGHTGRIHALSRHGLRPQEHRAGPVYGDFLAGRALPDTVLGMLRLLRLEVKRARNREVDWRAVVDAIRPYSQRFWQGLSWKERARFMRHVRPFWEVHRHRIAPPIAADIAQLEATGQLAFYAGRLTSLIERADDAEAKFRPRGTSRTHVLHVAKVINCTGPRSDYSKYQHPLLVNLLSRGLIDHDPLALGISALPEGEVLRYRAGPVGWLYTLGAPLKGILWESTALPEIRTQAAHLARKLLAAQIPSFAT